MKKTYETPVAEKVEFCYEDQIVASGTSKNMPGQDESICEIMDKYVVIGPGIFCN